MSWEHMTDKNIAEDIRARVSELNEIVKKAQARDIIVNYVVKISTIHDNPIVNLTISQRL